MMSALKEKNTNSVNTNYCFFLSQQIRSGYVSENVSTLYRQETRSHQISRHLTLSFWNDQWYLDGQR